MHIHTYDVHRVCLYVCLSVCMSVGCIALFVTRVLPDNVFASRLSIDDFEVAWGPVMEIKVKR